MIKKNQVEHLKTERRILELIDHPFIIKLKYAFQTKDKLYLVMDYCPGGEIFFHIQRVERFNEDAARFYAAQLVMAISHLHENNIIYRDLKPENVLIDRDGYIKVTDFGLSKQNILDNHSTNSFCGTPEYLAPEIVENKGHGKAVDWWSLGAIIFEMLTGVPPFSSKDRNKLFNSIKIGEIRYPSYISKEALSLMNSLFIKDPDQRLGSGDTGLEEIINHPFFNSIDWKGIAEKKIQPPFVPKLKSDVDTRYIDKLFTEENPLNSYNVEDASDQNVYIFKGFSYNPDVSVKH